MTNQTATHFREYGGLLAVPEKKALLWLAERMPARVNSDHLTLLGLISMFAAGGCFWLAGWNRYALFAVVAALALNWFGDSLDGTLARVRNRQRVRYGYYVDHVIDLGGTAALLAGMAMSGFMTPLVAAALLSAYVLVAAETFLATHVRQVFQLSRFGFGPTELRIILSIGAIRLFADPWVHLGGGRFLLFDIGGIIAATGLLAAFLYSAVRNTRRLYKEEPLGKQ
ncbi:MAG: CDP-alcohol phosphatidyltransferase family protein [Acidobacteriota bacterium]|nr:CDP-alcohol phosphatidyltransferase family protein [Acidobacteriota bacterium]